MKPNTPSHKGRGYGFIPVKGQRSAGHEAASERCVELVLIDKDKTFVLTAGWRRHKISYESTAYEKNGTGQDAH